MAAATKKEKKRLTLGRLALVAGTQQTLSNLIWMLSISMRDNDSRQFYWKFRIRQFNRIFLTWKSLCNKLYFIKWKKNIFFSFNSKSFFFKLRHQKLLKSFFWVGIFVCAPSPIKPSYTKLACSSNFFSLQTSLRELTQQPKVSNHFSHGQTLANRTKPGPSLQV
jgi:hypothetical protein